MERTKAAILLSLLPASAARLELAQRGSAISNVQCAAFLAVPRRRWLSDRRSGVLIKDDLLRDNPRDVEADEDTPPPQRFKPIFTDDRPEAMICIEQIREVLDEFDERVLAGEVQGKTDRVGHFYDNNKPRLHLPLNFTLLDSAWDALWSQATMDAYFKAIPNPAWPDWVIGGHDKPRVASKIGQGQARILAMMLLTLKGAPFLFAGDEIGMEQVEIPHDRVVDPFEKLVGGYGLNQDPERTPMRREKTDRVTPPRGGSTTFVCPLNKLVKTTKKSLVHNVGKPTRVARFIAIKNAINVQKDNFHRTTLP
jgi:glycosidase